MSHPTYKQAQAAKRLMLQAELDPLSVSAADLIDAMRIREARSDYLSKCHRTSPRYRRRGSKAADATKRPAAYCLDECLRLVNLLRTYSASEDGATALEASQALEALRASLYVNNTDDDFL